MIQQRWECNKNVLVVLMEEVGEKIPRMEKISKYISWLWVELFLHPAGQPQGGSCQIFSPGDALQMKWSLNCNQFSLLPVHMLLITDQYTEKQRKEVVEQAPQGKTRILPPSLGSASFWILLFPFPFQLPHFPHVGPRCKEGGCLQAAVSPRCLQCPSPGCPHTSCHLVPALAAGPQPPPVGCSAAGRCCMNSQFFKGLFLYLTGWSHKVYPEWHETLRGTKICSLL